MAWIEVENSDRRRNAECLVTISRTGTLSVAMGAMRKFEFQEGQVTLLRDPSDEDRLGFRFVEKGGTPFRALRDKNEKVIGYSASMAGRLENVPGFTMGTTMAYEFDYDPEGKAYYFYLSTGKVVARNKKKSAAADEVKKILEASSASAETDGAGDEEAAA